MEGEETLEDRHDPRATLGVRPGVRPVASRPTLPKLQLGNNHQRADSTSSSRPPSPRNTNLRVSLQPPITSPSAGRSPSNVTALTGLTTATDPSPPAVSTGANLRRRRRPTLARKLNAAGLTANRGQYENQKLLQHLLDRLDETRKGQDILTRAVVAGTVSAGSSKKHGMAQISKAVAAATVRTTNAAGKALTGVGGGAEGDDYDDDITLVDDGEWDTEATYDLLEQTRSLLCLADKQGIDLFGESSIAALEAAKSAAKSRKRVGRRFSTMPGVLAARENNVDNVFGAESPGPTLLRRLATSLKSLIYTDCMYITRRFRLLKPPYALQTMVLDVAALLYHKGDLEIKLLMMNAIIDAFYTFGTPMRDRICQWLEGRMGELLRDLARDRVELDEDEAQVDFNDPFASPSVDQSVESPSVPTFAFSAPDEPVESPSKQKGWMRFSPQGTPSQFQWPDKLVGLLSTHSTSNVSSKAIQIAALVPRMLVAMTSVIDLTTSNLTTIHCVHRLLSLILTAKPDSGIDLLEIIANAPPVARRRGMDILATYYARTVGHNSVARRPALTTYAAHRSKWETGQDRALQEDDVGHYYVAWRSHKDKCVACNEPVHGLCAQCTLCSDIRHIHCLKLHQSEIFEYQVTILGVEGLPSRLETVWVRFSLVAPRPDELVITGNSVTGDLQATRRKVGKHQLHLVNLFTLSLCDGCKQPLWGTSCQAYACLGGCQRLYHPTCVDTISLYTDVPCQSGREVYLNPKASTIEEVLDPFTTSGVAIHESFHLFKNKLCYDPSKLASMSYDEVACLYANIWLQHEIYLHGVAGGTLRLLDVPIEDDITGIALLLRQYENMLTTDLPPSPAFIDFGNVAQGDVPDLGCLLWHIRYLQYCAALIRAPSEPPSQQIASLNDRLLTVDPMAASPNLSVQATEPTPIAYEQVPMRVVQQCLVSDMHLRDDLAASTLVEQLRCFGLVSVPNKLVIDVSTIDDGKVQVVNPLPLLMDSSPAVELLVFAIEGLLDDVDLTANEQGLNMAVKLAWPSSMCSPYAMSRLGSAIMSWIMDEDDVLHYVVKSYASKRKRPPGVRNILGRTLNEGGTLGNSTVAAYKDDRGLLLQRYARPWLEALCTLDPAEYTELAYESSKNVDNRYEVPDFPKGDEAPAHIAGIVLEKITALVDSDVMFNGSLDLLCMWLADLGAIIDRDIVFRPLPRLLRHANSHDQHMDIWTRLEQLSDENQYGLEQVCRWLRVLTGSGVVVPWSVIRQQVAKHSVGRSTDETLFNLVMALDANTASIEPLQFAEICNNIFIPLAVSMGMRTTIPTPREVEMLRISMLSLLKVYGTPAEAIAETSLFIEGKAVVVPSNNKRKPSTVMLAKEPTAIEMHSEVIFAACRMLPNRKTPSQLVLDFLWLLFTKAANVENPRGFIHEISVELYDILWPLYDRHDINRRSRGRLFLKLLTLNSASMEDIVLNGVKGRGAGATRERLLEFVLELSDESICAEVDGWRRASVGLIALFFDTALQPLEPTPETLVIWKALLPSQLHALTACFEEYLESCPDEQRLQLIVKLLRLQAHLPSWRIVGWGIIEQIASEKVGTLRQLEGNGSVQGLSVVTEAHSIRASVLALGMRMLAAGVSCEWMDLQRFQQHVAAACAQPWPEPSDTITGILLPALKTTLDSTARTPILDSHGRAEETTLVGALFVAIVINFASDLPTYDFIVQRTILDILLVVYFKHNVQPHELSALSTLQRLASFAAEDNPNDNRLLALQVLRTAQARMPKDRFSRVLPALFVRVADVMFAETTADGDSAIIDSCREFLQASSEEFGKAGLFLQVLRADKPEGGENRAPEAIGRAMEVAGKLSGNQDMNKTVWLDQVMLDLPEVFRWSRDDMSQVFQSLSRLSVTLDKGFSEESALEFGAFLSRLGKHAAEWDSPEDIDLNPVLQTCNALLKICPSTASLPLLHQVSNFLHTVLSRYNVHLEPLQKLVPVSIRVARVQQTDNTVANVVFELCGAALKGLKVTAVTLKTLIDWLGDKEDTNLNQERLTLLVDASPGCAAILTRTHPTLAHMRDAELAMGIFKGAATVIVRAEMQLAGNTGRVLRSLPNEAAVTQLDVFAHILYASLDLRLGNVRQRLMSLYPVLGRATSLSLYACTDLLTVPDPHSDGAHLASAAFVVMRLAILAVQDPPPADGTFDTGASATANDVLLSFWNRLWPEWERLLGLSVAPSCVNLPQRAVTLSVLMDIILFISANNPSLLMGPAPTIARGLATLEEWHHSTGTQVSAKLSKAAAALDAAALRSQSPANTRRAAMRAVWADMLATERLFSLKALATFE